MVSSVRRIRNRADDGASAVEYGLLVAAIAAVIVVIVFALGGMVRDVFNDACDDLQQRRSHAQCDDGAPPAPAGR